MANNERSFSLVLKGVWIRFLSIIIPFTFPAHITTALHRMRGVKVGSGSKISRTAYIEDSDPSLVRIGEKVWITAGVMILCHQRDLSHYKIGQAVMDCPLKTAPVTVKDGAHIGIGAILMPGVTIGEGAVIGAGSVVTKDIPDHSVAAGIPAKVLKKFS